MCNPALAPAVTGAFMGVLKAGAENAATMAEWRWRKNLEEMGEKSALEAMRTQYEQSATRQMQEQMSRGQEIAMIAKKAANVKAAATVRAGKAGVAGASVQALQQQFEKDSLQSIGVRKQEADWADAMAAQQREAIQQQAQSRIEAVQAPPEPSSAGRFMNTLSQAVSGAIQSSQFKSAIEPATPLPATTGSVSPFNPIAAPADIGVMNVFGAPPTSALSGMSLGTAMDLRPIPSLGIQQTPFTPFNFGFDPYNLGALNLNSPFGSLQIGGNY